METHKTLNGDVVEYAPTPAEARFLAHVVDAANNPEVTESELVALVYGPDNPMLRHGVLPGRGLVTTETWANPVHRVVMDLVDQKRASSGTLDPEAARARYTMTVTEAAEALGITTNSVRGAIQAGRLSHWRDGRPYYLDPAEVARYRVGNQGPTRRRTELDGGGELAATIGNAPGVSFIVKLAGDLAGAKKRGQVITGTVPAGWRRIAVRWNDKPAGKMEFMILEPADRDQVIERGEFSIAGAFKVVRHIPHLEAAVEAWKAFQAE